MFKFSNLGILSGIVFSAAVAHGELYNANWVLVNTTLGGTSAPTYPSNVLSQPFWTGQTVFTYDLLVETSPDDRFASAQINLSNSQFFNPTIGDVNVGPGSFQAIFPETAYDSYVTGPAGQSSVALNSGALGSSLINPSWSYSPPSGTEVLGGRQRIARVTYRDGFLGIPQQTPGSIQLASAPGTNFTIPPIVHTDTFSKSWVRRVSGAWEDPFNWRGGVPTGGIAFSDEHLVQPVTVSLNAFDTELFDVFFDSTHSVRLNGSRTINLAHFTVSGFTPVRANKGHHFIDLKVSLHDRTRFEVAADSSLEMSNILPDPTAIVEKSQPGILRSNALDVASLSITGGKVELLGSTASKVRSMAISSGAKLDLKSAGLAVEYTGGSPLADLTAAIVAERIETSAFGRVVGIAEASDFGTTIFLGQNISASTVLLRSTLAGDADLNGTVSIGDFSVLAANFNSGTRWAHGDFNYSGLTDIADFALLAANFNETLASRSAVPEPVFSSIAALALLLRRRR